MPSDASHFVDLPGGFMSIIAMKATPNGPLLVLLHGFGDSFTTWEGWVGNSSRNFTSSAWTFPGTG